VNTYVLVFILQDRLNTALQTNKGKTKQMKTTPQLSAAMVACVLGLGTAGVKAQNYTHYITATTCGNWNSAGIRSTNTDYQIGYSSELPNEQAAYYELNLDSVEGQTVTGCEFLIPGSTDYNITDYWGTVGGNNRFDHYQFKVGIRPQGSDTLAQVLTGNNSTTIYLDGADGNRNQDLGYEWTMEGLHLNKLFGSFTYNTARLQNEVNAGGNWIWWAVDEFDNGAGSENYIWGNTSYNTGIVLEITTTTAPAGTPPPQLPGMLANGTYTITSKSTGRNLDVFDQQTTNGTVVDSWAPNGDPNQEWTVTSIGNDSYEIIGPESGLSLDVVGQSLLVGAPVDIWQYLTQGNQQWVITLGQDAGTYTIEGAQDGFFLVPGATPGVACVMEPNDGNSDQEWVFKRFDHSWKITALLKSNYAAHGAGPHGPAPLVMLSCRR
jgi:hypothetical protein